MSTALTRASPDVQAFWAAYVGHLGNDPSERFFQACYFDDNEPSADELAELVVRGRKRATAALLWAHEAENEPLPVPGSLSVVTRWSGAPVCIIETTAVEVIPFERVGADFAAAEGEGDGSLAYWQRTHLAFFGRECARIGREFSPSAPVVCERFRVVFPADVAKNAPHPVVQ
ncbi:MAG: ASCH domain-containing protein [Chromatiales bacterium]|nr:ASCH domain-containing protein [Chromatiales bacterium]